MTTHDAINAGFEGGGALFLCLNVRRLLRDKSVKGVSLVPSVWWTAWGFWNVYFYAAVSCSASFWAGLAVVSVQSVWVVLAIWFAVDAKAREACELVDPEIPTLRGAYGLPLCECATPKEVIPSGCRRALGWCGRCGKDLEAMR